MIRYVCVLLCSSCKHFNITQYMMFNKYYIYQMENGIRYAKIVLEQNKPK